MKFRLVTIFVLIATIFTAQSVEAQEGSIEKLQFSIDTLIKTLNTAPEPTEVAPVTPAELSVETCTFTFIEEISVTTMNTLLDKVKPCLQSRINTTLYMTSLGGDPDAASMFYDLIPIYGDRSLFHTVAVGEVASAAVVVFLSGGKRDVGKHGKILVHEARAPYRAMEFSKSDIHEL